MRNLDIKKVITAAQCRAARAWLDWNQGGLADHSGIALKTISDFERGRRNPVLGTLTLLRQTFEKTGKVTFEDDGLVLRSEPSSE